MFSLMKVLLCRFVSLAVFSLTIFQIYYCMYISNLPGDLYVFFLLMIMIRVVILFCGANSCSKA